MRKVTEMRIRKVNAQVVIFRKDINNNYWTLIQKRSEEIFMAGYLGVIGGQRDTIDNDSIDTAIREVEEETGLLCNNNFWKHNKYILGPIKFSEGKNVDWFVIKIPNTITNNLEVTWFSRSAKCEDECSNIGNLVSHLRPYNRELPVLWREPFGHCWVRFTDLDYIERHWETKMPRDNGNVKVMGGLFKKIKEAYALFPN